MSRTGTRWVVASLAAVIGVTAGCSSDDDSSSLNTREPETAAVSPQTTTPPAGTVADERYGGAVAVTALAYDSASGHLATLVDAGSELLLTPTSGEARRVELAEPGTSVQDGVDGEVLVTTAAGITIVDAATGDTRDLAVDGGAASVRPYRDGLAVGTPTGFVRIFDADGTETQTIGGFAAVDGLSVTGDELVALDTAQTSVTSISVDSERLGPALRAGDGATNITDCANGAIVVADTTDNEVLILATDDLLLRQRFPVEGSPFAVACDDTDGTVWVTTTATNEVVGFDIASGIPVETERFATVRQPDTLAVDSQSGTLFVGSTVGEGVQVLPTR